MYIISYDLNTEKIENIANENLRTTWAKHKENADEFLFVRRQLPFPKGKGLSCESNESPG